MMKLLKKEFRLCMHPAALIMLGLSALVLIPNYPYAVSYFYMTLGLYFICLDGRENHDAGYTLSLPVSRKEAVRGRMLFACCLEGAQLLLCGLMVLVNRKIYGPDMVNQAGMDANLAVVGQGLIVFGLYNVIFFPSWYRDVNKVGGAFLKASAAVFLYIALGVVATYALPFVRDQMDNANPDCRNARLIYTACALAFYLVATAMAEKLSVKRFEKLDLAL